MSEKMSPADEAPLLVRHGKKIWRDVVETKATAETILGLMAPAEESPVLDLLVRIDAKLDTLLLILLPPTAGTSER
ncbi:hypothetical protein CCR94_10800 [Rhodoblastus sphagnicola]|uniref:Uncharacterized protein n=1 Tax=Rhodoblastus sphagnicola TaxID=333368 RepID=A0A2S6N8P3_9HYPH|nr:hypothetical protein [Rhodoblastus sphagnicola]MBB4199939.1 hypothetical protein [Rhodoblastus sphagnicola]PPQ30961.1 hypothetical protein CCR94_10800 [Rhodoblastus sphagnicola]